MNLSKQPEVKKLVKQCLQANKTAQNELFRAVYGKMSTVCMRYAKNNDEAKDIFQTGMIKVFKNLDKYNFSGSFEGWIRRIIVNNAIDYLRKKENIFNEYYEDILYENIDEKFLTQNNQEELPKLSATKITDFVQTLPTAYRTVFNLFVMENNSHKEIAEKLNISVGTSKSNLSKAKIKLRKLLNQELVKIEKL